MSMKRLLMAALTTAATTVALLAGVAPTAHAASAMPAETVPPGCSKSITTTTFYSFDRYGNNQGPGVKITNLTPYEGFTFSTGGNSVEFWSGGNMINVSGHTIVIDTDHFQTSDGSQTGRLQGGTIGSGFSMYAYAQSFWLPSLTSEWLGHWYWQDRSSVGGTFAWTPC